MESLPEGVLKRQGPEAARVEAAKTVRAHEIGASSGAFRAPRVLAHDPAAGTILLERIEGIVPLREALRGAQGAPLASAAGRALAVVHRALRLPDELARPLPAGWRDPEAPAVFLHGDYNVHNVFLAESTGRLVILDWAMTDVWGGAATRGPPGFDVAWFINSLFFRRALDPRALPDPEGLARAFMEGYTEGSGASPPARELADYLVRASALVRASHVRRQGIRFPLYAGGIARFRRFSQTMAASGGMPTWP